MIRQWYSWASNQPIPRETVQRNYLRRSLTTPIDIF